MDFMNYVELAEAKQYQKGITDEQKFEVRNRIIRFYQEKFLDRMNDYASLESLDAANRTTINAICSYFRNELNNYYDCKFSSKNDVLVVRGILMQAGIYKPTAYKKNKDVFRITKFARDYLPDAVYQVWRLIYTDKARFEALLKFADCNADYEVVNFLQTSKKNCRIV